MPRIETFHEFQRLTDLYESKGDEELLKMRADLEDLTEIAQGVLRDELRKRSLWADPKPEARKSIEPPEFQPLTPGVLIEDQQEIDLIRIGGVPIYESDERNDAAFICYVLKRAGIKAALTRKEHDLYFRLPQVRVAPDDVEKALAVIERPIPESIRFEYEEQCAAEAEDFVPPSCPQCSAPDPSLESADPVNTWRCEECDAAWQDPLPRS